MSQIIKGGNAGALNSYTVSGLPSASPADQVAYASDCGWSGGAGCLVTSNGTNWMNPNGGIASTTFTGPGLIFTQTADGTTITNSTTETSLVGTGLGSMTIPQNAWAVGKTYQFGLNGLLTTSASPPTLTLKLKMGSTILWSQATIGLSGSFTNSVWEVTVNFICRTTGGSGTIVANPIDLKFGATSFTDASNPVTVSLTGSNLLDFTCTCSAADASTSIKSNMVTLVALN